MITPIFEDRTPNDKFEFALYKKQLIEYRQKIEEARNILLSGGIDAADYRLIKNDCERQISLERKLIDSSKSNQGIGPLLNRALENLSRLPE